MQTSPCNQLQPWCRFTQWQFIHSGPAGGDSPNPHFLMSTCPTLALNSIWISWKHAHIYGWQCCYVHHVRPRWITTSHHSVKRQPRELFSSVSASCVHLERMKAESESVSECDGTGRVCCTPFHPSLCAGRVPVFCLVVFSLMHCSTGVRGLCEHTGYGFCSVCSIFLDPW